MNTRELSERLLVEGCNPTLYAIGSRGVASDAFCLTFTGTQWQVYYKEKGNDDPPIYASRSEAQACEFFFEHVMSMDHDHCVGIFRSQENANATNARLQAVGLKPWQDRIPYGGPHDPRFRVFVKGKAIFGARTELSEVPVRDA